MNTHSSHPGGDIQNQIMWNRLIAIVEEQAQTLLRTAFSPIVREAGDLSAGVFDCQGRMLAQAVTGTPGHVNSMAESVKHFVAHFGLESMKPGDAYITNDPWLGTGHLNDFVVTTPSFHNGKLIGLFSCTSHLIDIGGIGFGPEAADVFMEGLYIPMLPLIQQGVVNETLIEMIRANTRMPVDTVGDTYALVSCNEVGVERLEQMMQEFDMTDLDGLGDFICDRSEAAVKAKIAELPSGSWTSTMVTDGYDDPVTLTAKVTITDDSMHVDFTDSSGLSAKGINVPMAYTTAYTVFGLSCIVASDIPKNAGSLKPLTVSAPLGTIVNAPKPAPVCSRHVIGQMLPDVVFGCLYQAIPDRVPAEGCSCLWNLNVRGRVDAGEAGAYGFSMAFTSNGGTGARPESDGLSATAFPSGVKGTPVEIAEQITPLIFWRKQYRPNSGGAGKTRGGMGQEIEVESRNGAPFELLAAYDRIDYPARGRDGGSDGAPGSVRLRDGGKLKGKGFLTVPSDDRLIIETPGGGGLGNPSQRDASRIDKDKAAGLVG